MEEIKQLLEARENQLKKWKKEVEKALAKAPEGSLRFCRHGNKTQYYHRNNPKDFNGVYIREKEMGLVKKLAQKDYNKKVLCSIEKEMKAINKYLSIYPEKRVEEIYQSLHDERQKLIKPIIETEEAYIRSWKEEVYQGKEFYEGTPEFYTLKGERVRSKSELIIADILNKKGIPYRYEYPIYLKGMGRIYPDFMLLNVKKREEVFWEHFGMMDDPTYAENAIRKIATYEQNGFFQGENLLVTYETRKNPINQKVVENLIEHFML